MMQQTSIHNNSELEIPWLEDEPLTWLVHRLLLIDWCKRSRIAFVCGFLTVMVPILIPFNTYMCMKGIPVNWPPLSCIQPSGRRNLSNQSFLNFIAIYSDVLLLICEISGKLVTVLTQVGAWNSIACAVTVIFHGPMKSTVTSEHCNNNAFLGGSSPKPSIR